ncbi:hypothetical protein DPEC_G00102820 [Dallia pectoralis]|uniref:Uncharacterized protein n=1 Tax=Dallia pectoralis TaxID=75939 RepID=A0ACC2GXM2_DALPE|nr:hypothetical protein DPEC_G00102820 [Dallia pectoralis]
MGGPAGSDALWLRIGEAKLRWDGHRNAPEDDGVPLTPGVAPLLIDPPRLSIHPSATSSDTSRTAGPLEPFWCSVSLLPQSFLGDDGVSNLTTSSCLLPSPITPIRVSRACGDPG